MDRIIPYICSFVLHAILFILIYSSLSHTGLPGQSGNNAVITKEETAAYDQVSGQNNMKSDENKREIGNEYNRKYRSAYNNMSETMKKNISNNNYKLNDFVNDVDKNQKIIDKNFSEYTKRMIDEEITNSILKNSADFIKNAIKDDIKKDFQNLNSNRPGALKELGQINREAVKATLKKLDAAFIKKYQDKLSLEIRQKYSKISLMPENRKQLKKIMDESGRYLKSKIYIEAARQDIFKEDLKNDQGMDKPDINTKEGGNPDLENEKKTIDKLEKSLTSLVEKSDELESKPDTGNIEDYKRDLSLIRESIKDQLTDLKDRANSPSIKETADNMLSEIGKDNTPVTNMDQLKDEYKKIQDETAENISGINFKAVHPDRDKSAEKGDKSPENEALDGSLKMKIDKSAQISSRLSEISMEEDFSNQLYHYNAEIEVEDAENNKAFVLGRHPGDSTDPTSTLKHGESQGMGMDSTKMPAPRYQDTKKGSRTAGAGSGGGRENGVAFGNGYGSQKGDERFTKKMSTEGTGMSFSSRDLIEFMRKFGNRTMTFDADLKYSTAWGDATAAVPVSYNYPKYVYVPEDLKSQIEELVSKNESENNRKELRFYSSFPAYARIPYQPHDLKINGDISEWGELDYPIQMQYAANNGHDILTNGVKLYMRWNESGFYFLYKSDKTNGIVLPDEIEDDYDAASQDVTQDKCDGDTFEFWLDQDKKRLSTVWGDWYTTREYVFSPFVAPGLYIESFHRHSQVEDNVHVRITNVMTPSGYMVEAFMSKDVLADKMSLHPKMQLSCNFSINQGSDWGPRSTQWAASIAIGTRYRPDTWGCVELMGYKPEIEIKDCNQEGPRLEFIFPGQALKIYIKDPERIMDAGRLDMIPAYAGIAGSTGRKKINLIETEKGSGLFCASINTKANINSATEEALLIKPGDILFIEYSKYDESSVDRIYNQKFCLYLPVVNSFFTTMK